MQRFFDILFSIILLFLLLPFFVFIIFILKITGEGSIFFIQERIGFRQKAFKLLKFSTMLKNSPNMKNGTITLKNDPRILPIGNILRKTKINELPQLINILKGDMSFVGPRPQTFRCFNAFSKKDQTNIIKIRPGLTGIGSLIFRNEENMLTGQSNPNFFYDTTIMEYKGSLESWYSENQNIKYYFLIIILTFWSVIFPNTKIVWIFFPSIPKPSKKLKKILLDND